MSRLTPAKKRALLLLPLLLLPLAYVINSHARARGPAANRAPVAGEDTYTGHGSSSVEAPGFLANDSDPDGDPIRLDDAPGCRVTQNFGSFCIHNARDGGFTYHPPRGFSGTDTSFYTICDPLNWCTRATVTFNVVNSAPSAQDDYYTVTVGGEVTVNAPGFLANDTDADGDLFSAVDEHPTGACGPLRSGWLCRSRDGFMSYRPSFDYPGSDSYVYKVCDSLGACATATMHFDIRLAEPSPTPTPPPPPPTPEPTPTPDPCGGGALAGAFSAAGDDLAATTPCPPPPPPPPPTPTPTPEPVIFIPGIGGSRLVSINADNETTVWPPLNPIPVGNTLTLDPAKPQRNIYAADAVRQIVVRNPISGNVVVEVNLYNLLLNKLADRGYPEYEVNRDPLRRTTAGCDLGQKERRPLLFVFAYDWRKSSAENALLLKDYVGCVRRFYPDQKVNLLAHSMGGLLARRYLLDNPGAHHVSQLITVGTPWLGAPKAIHVMETGEFFGGFLSMQIKELVEFFPGMHQLLPSRSYFALGGRPFGEAAGKEHWDVNEDGKVNAEYTFTQLAELLDTKHFVRTKPAQTANVFHDAAGQDDWRDERLGVEYEHILGVQYFRQTIEKVVALKKKRLDAQKNPVMVNDYDERKGYGDGTVPRLSAERKGLGTSLNAPRAKIHTLVSKARDIAKYDERVAEEALHEHTGLTQNPKVWDIILSALRPPPQPQQAAVQEQPTAMFFIQQAAFEPGEEQEAVQEEPTPAQGGEGYYLRIGSVGELLVTDSSGNDTSPIEGTQLRRTLPLVDVTRSTPGEYDISLPAEMAADEAYTVTFRSTGEPIEIEIVKGEGNSPSTANQIIRYLDLNLPSGTPLLLKFTPQGVEDLRYDGDGDGAYESTVRPTATATGEAARDAAAPVVAFAEKAQGGKRLITIMAEDKETGVLAVWYSLDGKKFESYTAPFEIDACRTRTVYAFADDNVANRSETFEHRVADLPPDVTQARPAVAALWPPNHKMVAVSVEGVTDPDCGGPVTINVTRITQDEPTDDAGDGATCPDAQGVGTSAAQLRAERGGSGNGRVYTIYFTATDGTGNRSQGSVKVGVPKSSKGVAVDDRVEHDSTACPR